MAHGWARGGVVGHSSRVLWPTGPGADPLSFGTLCDHAAVDVEPLGDERSLPTGDSEIGDRLRTVFAADDLTLGSPEVQTAAERSAAISADRSSDVFRAFGFDGGDSVLLIAPVDGGIARFLAETVRSVVVVATGSAAELVGARCRTLSNVSVVESMADAAARRLPFNAVFSPRGPIDSEHLASLAPVIDDATMVVWAEHNPFGLDRLFGSSTAAELVAGHTLADQQDAHDALANVGLRLRSTLYPYPSLAAPTMMLAPPLFRHDQKAELFDLLTAQAAPNAVAADPGADGPDSGPDRLRALLLAGAARSLMPTRLVVASRVALPATRFDCTVAAWTYERSADPVWCSMHRFVPADDGATAMEPNAVPSVRRSAERLFPERGRAERGWVSMPLVDDATVTLHAPLQNDVLRAVVRGDVEHTGTLLKQWRSALRAHEVTAAADDEPVGASPFSATASESRLASEWFDVRMANVALDATTLRLLGQRFRITGFVATDLVVARAYWYLARDILAARLPHPWSSAITVDELAQTLGAQGGENIGPAILDRWRSAEAELLSITAGDDAATYGDRLMSIGTSDSAALASEASGADLRSEVARLRGELDSMLATAEASDARRIELESQLAAAVEADAGTIEDLRAELADLTHQRDRQDDKIEAQSRLLTEVIRKYERAVHERNMVEQGMHSYRRVVTIAKRVMPTDVYFRVRKIVRGH